MMRPIKLGLALMSLAFAGACASMPRVSEMLPSLPQMETSPERSPREHVRVAIERLDVGDEAQARVELRAALEAQPNNAAARRLLDQIERDPHALLGDRSRAYTVRQGETMSELAERYLGDGLLFYALARYNGMSAPNQLSAGQTLMIPQRAATTAPLTAAAAEAPPPPAPASTAASLPRRGVDPAAAGQLRLQALQRLNTGDVDGAVAQLQRAQALDPANPAIQRDLDRALRMQASLRTASRN